MTTSNNALVNKLKTINGISAEIQLSKNCNGVTLSNFDISPIAKQTLQHNIDLIKEGMSQWEKEFIIKNSHRPTYSDMRTEFG